jgi:hypothetical protein
MSFVLFGDESGINPDYKCYGIGILIIPENSLSEFSANFKKLITKHGVIGEVKWQKVSTGYGLINFGIDLLRMILSSEYRFSVIVVNKVLYNKWREGNYEEAFYTSLSFLLRDRIKITLDQCILCFDRRPDRYSNQNQVIQKITNYMLNKLQSEGSLENVIEADSQYCYGIQTADFFTGAITAAHNKYLDQNVQIANGKLLAIKKMAETLGWDDLCYDTYPNEKFNIWNFPIEYRANAGVSRTISFNNNVSYVRPEELA